MSSLSSIENAKVEILKALPQDKVWNVVIAFPGAAEGLQNDINVTAPLTYSLSRIEGWTDEPVDMNEVMLIAANNSAQKYKLVAGDDESVPDAVQTRLLSEARDIMFDVSEDLSRR